VDYPTGTTSKRVQKASSLTRIRVHFYPSIAGTREPSVNGRDFCKIIWLPSWNPRLASDNRDSLVRAF